MTEVPYTLLIIDMQEGYSAATNDILIGNIANEIKEAKRNGAAIIFVTMKDEDIGRVVSPLWEMTYDYKYFVEVKKRDTDGSKEVVAALKKYHFLNKNRIKAGGVYTDVCVADTVNGLAKKLPDTDIEVLSHCCHADVPGYEMNLEMYEDDGETYNPFLALKNHPNLKLIF